MRLRPPVPADLDAVYEVIRARDIADHGEPDYTLEDLRDEWAADAFDLHSLAVVAELDGGRIAGYAVLQPPGSLAVVHPACEGRGVGAALLQWTEERDRALGRARHRQVVATTDARGQALLRTAGYAYVRSYSRMVRVLDDEVLVAALPPGLRLRALDPARDAATVHALDDAAFSSVPDYHPQSLEEFVREHLSGHDFAPDLSLVAERDERAVGFLAARRWREEGTGYIDLLAVHPDEQRGGLGTALLTTAFAAFRADGLREAHLGVASDNPKALTVYERAGMAERFRGDDLQRPV
jgi:mycothiol synthase